MVPMQTVDDLLDALDELGFTQAQIQQAELDEAARLLGLGYAPRYADHTGTMIVQHLDEMRTAQRYGVAPTLALRGH